MNNSIEIYHSQDGSVQLNVKLENETVWLTQSQMAELFGKDRTTINRHISNIFKEGELDESLVCAKNAHTKNYGRRSGFTQVKEITLYNLDVIISVGYRVKSVQGTRYTFPPMGNLRTQTIPHQGLRCQPTDKTRPLQRA